MKIALIGYGKMGKAIEQIALGRGHEIVSVVDVNNPEEIRSERFKSADVAIEFTTPATAFDNYMKCFAAGVPVVSGTTGWLDRLDEVKAMCANEGKTFFYASNFSIGVNIFFALNKYLAVSGEDNERLSCIRCPPDGDASYPQIGRAERNGHHVGRRYFGERRPQGTLDIGNSRAADRLDDSRDSRRGSARHP